jgi:glycosyltransferase involved in cell wall biosynthesis
LRATSHAFIVPSQDMETDLRYKGFVHHPVHVIRHYVETKGALPYPRGEFLGGDAPLIVAGGRLVQDKGFDILLQVCSKLKSPFHLIISGIGPEEGTLKAMAVSLGLEHKVTFLGWRDDFQHLLATADIVAMPSRYEPFGLVLLEAMAQKSAVIVSDVSGPKSILAKSDGAAIMLPLEDREGWIFQLERLLKNINDRKSLSETGYNYVLHHYGAEATRVCLMDFYQSLL